MVQGNTAILVSPVIPYLIQNPEIQPSNGHSDFPSLAGVAGRTRGDLALEVERW